MRRVIFLFSLFLLSGGLLFNACTPVDISAPPQNNTDTTAGFATLQITNHKDQDPGPLTFLLFASTTTDITNAANGKTVGTVGTNETKSFQVPAGTWKMAYQNSAGVLSPMEDATSQASEWLKAQFVKGASYSLIIATDGNLTVWQPSFPVVP